MKRFILAFDSFKGTMTAKEVCSIVEKSILTHLPDANIISMPMADGGEGMTNSFVHIFDGQIINTEVTGPLGSTVNAQYAILPDGSAVIEMAACAGLPLIENHKDPLLATTFGVGELILDSVKHGARRILLGLGGSATNDLGIGMASALGYRFYDNNNNEINPYAKNLNLIKHIKKPSSLPDLDIIAACDVNNILYGPKGATYTYGMQKGATDDMLILLDAGLKNVAKIIEKDLHISIADLPGSGAAGGMGAAVVAFLGGQLTSGIELLLEAANFDTILNETDMVFTGEGCIDSQSINGKVPIGVALHAQAKGVPCIALCGSTGAGVDKLYDYGITAIFSSVRNATDFETIKQTCREDMYLMTDSVIRILSKINQF